MIENYKHTIKSIIRTLSGSPQEMKIIPIIENYINNNLTIDFMVIGANDGDDADIIKFAIDNLKGSGILVEPQKIPFEKLSATYIHRDNLSLINKAIDNKVGEKDFFSLNINESRWSSGLSSFSKETLIKHFDNGYIQKRALEDGIELNKEHSTYIKKEVICTTTIDKIIEDVKMRFPKLIFIDTEGYDYEIIKSINIQKNTPDIVFFEHLHLGKTDYKNCIKLFRQNDYCTFFKGRDTLALKKGTWAQLRKQNF